MQRPFAVALVVAFPHLCAGTWRRQNDTSLTTSYRSCPFMMARYMEGGESTCEDGRFFAWEGRVGSTENRSTAAYYAGDASVLDGRRIVFMGDSLTRQHFVAAACRLYAEGAPLLDSRAAFEAHRNSNRSSFLKTAAATFAGVALVLDADAGAEGLEAYATAQCGALGARDVLVLNQGAHYSADHRRYAAAVESAFRAIGLLKKVGGCPATVFWRETAPNHFASGVWHGKGTCHDRTATQDKALRGSGLYPALNRAAATAARANGLFLLKVYQKSLSAGAAAHVGGGGGGGGGKSDDCLHWCLPGVPDLWTLELLLKLAAVDRIRAAGEPG